MGEKIVLGLGERGLNTEYTAFKIDNAAFPVLLNAYQWRGRVKRKRGTKQLGQLNLYVATTDGSGNASGTISPASIIGIGTTHFSVGTDLFTDPGGASPVNLITTSTLPGAAGTLNRATGAFTISNAAPNTAVLFYPSLPVMGIEDLEITSNPYPGTIAFDTTWAYNVSTNDPYTINNVSFYKNPPASGSLPGYVPKGTWTTLHWNGQNYQQFWSTNYEGALWVTNGITVPFSTTNIGMQFGLITAVAITAGGPPAIINITIGAGTPLVIGDFVFINEIVGMTGINFQTGYVINVAGNVITVEFPNATSAGAWISGGIVQYLTNVSDSTKDVIRWYDGDPTGGTIPPVFTGSTGWVNFMPPLSFANYNVGGLSPRQYYLVGARMIVPFKDRLIFFGCVVQASSGSPIYLQDTVIWSQNGTPYYTASFTGDPTLPTTTFNPILTPDNVGAAPNAFYEDITGYGGYLTVGNSQPITTVSSNEDALIVGQTIVNTRFIFTGNDADPFAFFLINSELGSSSTFSIVNMDSGVITRGYRGIIITNQTECRRIDLNIPDQVFEMLLTNNGAERICAARDFENEWVYMSYVSDTFEWIFPTATLFYNYRSDSWSVFHETYTTYGQFKETTGRTWNQLNDFTWDEWNDTWDEGGNEVLQPQILGGNQQGFLIFRETENTEEAQSLYIQNIASNTITCPNHCLNVNDFIIIKGASGTVGQFVNGQIFQITSASTNSFTVTPNIGTGTYLGGAYITRMYIPNIMTKQFPVSWELSRKTRLGPQQYLLTGTSAGQIQLLLFLSTDSSTAYNNSPIVPSSNPIPPTGVANNSLIYSTVLYTCPESTNLGLTPANTNLQMIVDVSSGRSTQEQIWHRMNTSLIGDTVQIGFTMSWDQMKAFIQTNQTFAITDITTGYPTVVTAANILSGGEMVQVTGAGGVTFPEGVYQVISATTSQITINATTTGAFTGGGIVTVMALPNQFAEIELHGAILDVQPSSVLA